MVPWPYVIEINMYDWYGWWFLSIFTTNLGNSGRWIFFHLKNDRAKNTNHPHTWAVTFFSHHSFSPCSCVIKMKNLNNTALLLKCVITFFSEITNYCKENCILLYNSYYKNSTNTIFLRREWIWYQWWRKPIISQYFDNIQPMNCSFFAPDPPTLFCLDGGKMYMDSVTLIRAKLTGIFSNSTRQFTGCMLSKYWLTIGFLHHWYQIHSLPRKIVLVEFL